MARYRRRISAYGHYHIMIRGVNRENIFLDDFDRKRFIFTMKRFSGETNVAVIVYCVMSNHVHILVSAPDGPDVFMKKLSSSYVYYFNHKYGRIGHLFQDRYKSEAVESDSYLLTAARYILQNPAKAGIAKIDNYEWNSWKDVASLTGFTKPEILYDITAGDCALLDYLKAENGDNCLDIEKQVSVSDDEAVKIIREITGNDDPEQISEFPTKERNDYLARMKEEKISVSQIEKITGISRNIIYKAYKV